MRLQLWHVEERDPAGGEVHVVIAFASRTIAEETRDMLNDDARHVGQAAQAYICLCDCPDRICKYEGDE